MYSTFSATPGGMKNGMIAAAPKKPSTWFATQLSSGTSSVASDTPPVGTPMVNRSSRIARSSAVSPCQTALEYSTVFSTTCWSSASIRSRSANAS